MASRAVAIDLGSSTIKVLGLKETKAGLQVTEFACFPATQKSEGLAASGIPIKAAVVGLSGRDMTLRYTQVPPSPDWQLRNLMELEIQDLSSQSGDQLSADYNLLPPVNEEQDSDTILMALARNEALERAATVVSEAGGSIGGHIPNCIAIYNAFMRAGPVEEDSVVCIANIGHETVDIALARGVDLLFARNLSGGGKVLDDAIVSAFNVSNRKAESLKKELLDLDPASRGKFASGQAEKVTMAAGGAATMLVSAIQSSVAFCKSQTGIADLQLDKILLCGGSARLRGVKGLLREALRCPVEVFDPFQNVDLSLLSAEEHEDLEAHRSESVVSLGLAASQLDDTLYSLEILPEAVKRRRRFVRRTIFNILAGVAAVVLLTMSAFSLREARATAEKDVKKLKAEARRVKRIHAETEKVVAANKLEAELVDLLTVRSLPLDGTVQVLRALRKEMPEELWVRQVSASTTPPRVRGESANPLVVVKGKAKEFSGRDLNVVYGETIQRLRAAKHLGDLQSIPEQKRDGIEFTFKFDFLATAKPKKGE